MECFTVNVNEIGGRIDPHFYRPKYRELEENIMKKPYKMLGDFASFLYGLGETAQEKGDIVYIRITDIDEYGNLKKDSLAYLNFNNTFKNYKLKKGDILIARTGATFGKSYFFNEDFDAVFAGYLIKICLNNTDEIKSKYLFYFMQTNFYWLQANQIMTGGGQPQFNANTIGQLKIPIPSKIIQEKIIFLMDKSYFQKKQKEIEAQNLLDSLNGYVLDELGIKLPELKDKMIYMVGSEEVQNKRIDAYYCQPKFEEFEKAMKKGKFEVKILKEISKKIESGQRPKGGVRQISKGVPSIGGEHVFNDGTIARTDLKFIPQEFHEKQLKSRVQKEDIILVKDGATTGKIGIIPEDYPFVEANINEHVFLFRIKEGVNPYYLFSILKSQLGQIQINREITGGTIMGIIRETAENLKIPLPPLPIQNKIAEEVKNRMHKAEQLQVEAKEELEKAKQKVEKIILGDN